MKSKKHEMDQQMHEMYDRLKEYALIKNRREKVLEYYEYIITNLKDLPRDQQLKLFNALILELACT